MWKEEGCETRRRLLNRILRKGRSLKEKEEREGRKLASVPYRYHFAVTYIITWDHSCSCQFRTWNHRRSCQLHQPTGPRNLTTAMINQHFWFYQLEILARQDPRPEKGNTFFICKLRTQILKILLYVGRQHFYSNAINLKYSQIPFSDSI